MNIGVNIMISILTWVDGLISPHIIVNCIKQIMSLRATWVACE